MSKEHHGENFDGPCTEKDKDVVAEYILADIVQKYLTRNHLMAIREHADNLADCSNPDNQYDKTDYFERKIHPIIRELEEACAAEGLPFVCAIQFGMSATSNETMMVGHVGGDTLYPGAPVRQMAEMMNVLMARPTEG